MKLDYLPPWEYVLLISGLLFIFTAIVHEKNKYRLVSAAAGRVSAQVVCCAS